MVPPVAMAALIFILDVTQNEYSWKSALWGSTKAAALSSVTISPFVCFPCLTITPVWAAFGLILRLALWWPMYILAFFPQLPYFPITGISIREMDQITALLGVAVVAALRIVRHVIPSC
ncbi:hypothetical protein B0H13DRAFT_2340633 [Mycena leptocephala]|nr:hypothetical protein B0H13DRAFT_2340633 [Mycena leptocephala]